MSDIISEFSGKRIEVPSPFWDKTKSDIIREYPGDKQERIGRDIKDILRIILDTSDIAVIVTASHSCMASRGIKKPGSKTTTKTLGGRFNDPGELQNLLTLI